MSISSINWEPISYGWEGFWETPIACDESKLETYYEKFNFSGTSKVPLNGGEEP